MVGMVFNVASRESALELDNDSKFWIKN